MQATLMFRHFVKTVSVYSLYNVINMQLLQLKQLFLDYLENSLGRSVKTIENYDRYLTRFIVFSKIKKPSELTQERINEFRQFLSRQAGTKVGNKIELMKPQTQNYYLIALRAFLKFLRGRGVVTVLPKQIELAKVPVGSLKLISSANLNSLLVGPLLSTLEGKRDQAILELLLSTGLRISELCGLGILDVDLAGAKLRVRGKGKKIRIVVLSKATKSAIKNYLAVRKDAEEALFIRYGKKAHIGEEARISPRTVQRLLKHYAAKAGLIGNVTPQVIRHTYATDLLNRGTDVKSVQELLGHAHIGTTEIYTHVIDTSLRDIDK